MKIYINNFNLLTWPKKMAEILSDQGHDVIFIDNKSTYEPLLEFYDKCPYKIIRLNENVGYTAPWSMNIVDSSDYYVVTDPDLNIDLLPEDWDEYCIRGIEKYKYKKDYFGNDIIKCGLLLDKKRVPINNPEYLLISLENEEINENGYVNKPIDTTFAVYKPGTNNYRAGGITTYHPYFAYHLPWHLVLENKENDKLEILMNDELYNYIITSKKRKTLSDNGFSSSSSRLSNMALKYKNPYKDIDIFENNKILELSSSDKIYITPYIKLENVDVIIKDLNDNMIYNNLMTMEQFVKYWIRPTSDTFLDGFTLFINKNGNQITKELYDFKIDNKTNIESKLDNIKICVISCCNNEEKIIPFYLDYYTNFVKVDKIVLYDDGSTDNTLNIARDYSNVEIIDCTIETFDERNLTKTRNTEWKKYKNDYDWLIVCDIDEILYHPDIRNKLIEYKNNGITIPKVEGFDMISLEFPEFEKRKYLPEIINRGIKDEKWLNKNIIFNPEKIIDMNYDLGSHRCEPTGEIKYSTNYDFKLLHYKWLSYEYLIENSKMRYDKLDPYIKTTVISSQYKNYITNTKYSDYLNKYNNSKIIIDNIQEYPTNKRYNKLKSSEGYDKKTKDIVKNYNDINVFLKDKIYITSKKRLSNIKIIIKNIYNDIIYNENNFILEPDIEYWISPGYNDYKNGFILEILDNENNVIYKKIEQIPLLERHRMFFIDNSINDQNFIVNKLYGLKDMINENLNKDCIVCEIGSFAGISSELFAINVKKLYCIDNWDINQIYGSDLIRIAENHFDNMIKNYNNIIKIKKKSEDTFSNFPDEYFDLVYIDGSHEYNDVKNDILNWLPKVKRDGIISGHDYYDDVKKAVDEIFNNINIKTYSDSSWVVKIKDYKKQKNTIEHSYKDIPKKNIKIDKIGFITPTNKRYDELKRCINSVLSQKYQNFEHLICSDGYDKKTEDIIKNYNNNRIKYYYTEISNDYGSNQRNYLIQLIDSDYVVFLDDDNYIYPNYIKEILNNISNTDMLVYKIYYDGTLIDDRVIPLGNRIEFKEIDSLNCIIRKDIVKKFLWDTVYKHDFLFFKKCEEYIINNNGTIKYIDNILARHCDNNISPQQHKESVIILYNNDIKKHINLFKDRKIILLSTYPVLEDIQEDVDFCIYKKENINYDIGINLSKSINCNLSICIKTYDIDENILIDIDNQISNMKRKNEKYFSSEKFDIYKINIFI